MAPRWWHVLGPPTSGRARRRLRIAGALLLLLLVTPLARVDGHWVFAWDGLVGRIEAPADSFLFHLVVVFRVEGWLLLGAHLVGLVALVASWVRPRRIAGGLAAAWCVASVPALGHYQTLVGHGVLAPLLLQGASFLVAASATQLSWSGRYGPGRLLLFAGLVLVPLAFLLPVGVSDVASTRGRPDVLPGPLGPGFAGLTVFAVLAHVQWAPGRARGLGRLASGLACMLAMAMLPAFLVQGRVAISGPDAAWSTAQFLRVGGLSVLGGAVLQSSLDLLLAGRRRVDPRHRDLSETFS